MDTPEDKGDESVVIGEWTTDQNEKITLRTWPKLGNGVMFSMMPEDSESQTWFSAYLDNDTLTQLGGALVGHSLANVFRSFGE